VPLPLVDALKREMLQARVLHAEETPVAMLKPGNGKTHRAYLWSYCTTASSALRAVVVDFAEGRGGQHARAFLGLGSEHGWRGTMVCDDFSGYKACFELGIIEAGCLAHARRKFYGLWANHGSQVVEQALEAGQSCRGVVAPSLAVGSDLLSCARRKDGITARLPGSSLYNPTYTLVDAALHYEHGPYTFALNATNLFNTTYVAGSGQNYGQGRALQAKA